MGVKLLLLHLSVARILAALTEYFNIAGSSRTTFVKMQHMENFSVKPFKERNTHYL